MDSEDERSRSGLRDDAPVCDSGSCRPDEFVSAAATGGEFGSHLGNLQLVPAPLTEAEGFRWRQVCRCVFRYLRSRVLANYMGSNIVSQQLQQTKKAFPLRFDRR